MMQFRSLRIVNLFAIVEHKDNIVNKEKVGDFGVAFRCSATILMSNFA